MTWRAARAAVVAALVTLLSPQRAEACSPLPPEAVHAGRPDWPEDSGVELVDESLELSCNRQRPRTVCSVRARYVYAAPEGGASGGELLWESSGELSELRVLVDGRELGEQVHREAGHAEAQLELDGPSGLVEVSASFSLDTDDINGCAMPIGLTRHPLVSFPPQVAGFTLYAYDERGGERGSHTQLRARTPPRWRVETDADRQRPRDQLSGRYPSAELSRLWMQRPGVMHGPALAAGVGFGPQIRARLRAGYELSIPDYMVYSVMVEGDAVEELALVPAVEFSSPALWTIIPGAGIGLGAPVMLAPQPRPGVRVQAALHWMYVGLVGNVDVYPRSGGAPLTLRGALMLQVSL